jgi:hypothetical protein
MQNFISICLTVIQKQDFEIVVIRYYRLLQDFHKFCSKGFRLSYTKSSCWDSQFLGEAVCDFFFKHSVFISFYTHTHTHTHTHTLRSNQIYFAPSAEVRIHP